MARALVVTKLAYEHVVGDIYIGIGHGLRKSLLKDISQERFSSAVVGAVPD